MTLARSGWTVDTMRALLDARLDAIERAHADHLRWSEAQVLQMQRQIADLTQRTEQRTDALEARVDIAAGRDNGIAAGWGYLVGIIGVASSIVAVVLALANRN